MGLSLPLTSLPSSISSSLATSLLSSSSGNNNTPASSRSLRCALKVDRPNGRQELLKWESDILLKLQKYPFFPRHYGFFDTPKGSLTNKVLVMSLLGSNISNLRRHHPGSQLPYGICINMTIQMVLAVEAVHQEGYIHRDLKPSNFVIGLDNKYGKRQLFLLDFGQSRQYIEPSNGSIRPARETAEFRGTSLYSSYNAHLLRDLGRRDDLWSIFYVLIDMCRGGLPWRIWKDDRKRCENLKQYYYNHPKELVQDIPGEEYLLQIQEHLLSLSFTDRPDYGLIINLLRKSLQDAVTKNVHKNRPRPPYTDTKELISLVETLNNPNFNCKGPVENEIEEGEIGEDGPTILTKGTGKVFVPFPSSVPSVILSPPPFSNPDGTKLVTGESIGSSTTATTVSSSSSSSLSVGTGTDYSIDNVHYTVDRYLYSRGGKWSPYTLEEIKLDNILTYDVYGSLSPAALDAQNKLEKLKQEYMELLSGWEEEIDDVSATDGITDIVTVHKPKLPEWLRQRRRLPVTDRIPGDIDIASIDDIIEFIRKKLRELSNALFWGAGLVLTKASVPTDESATLLTPALGAAIEYASAWSGIVNMVMNTSVIKNLNKEDTIAEYVQKAIQQLYLSISGNSFVVNMPTIHSIDDELSQNIIRAANEGYTMIIKRSVHTEFLQSLSSSSVSLTYTLSPFIRQCTEALGANTITNITLRVQKSIGIIEQWLATNSHKLPPATGVSSILEKENPSSILFNPEGSYADDENDDSVLREEREQRQELRNHLGKIQRYLHCLQREREMLRVITSIDIPTILPTVNRMNSSSSSSTSIGNVNSNASFGLNSLASISSNSNISIGSTLVPSSISSNDTMIYNLLHQATSESNNQVPVPRKRSRWGDTDNDTRVPTAQLSASVILPNTHIELPDDEGENMDIE